MLPGAEIREEEAFDLSENNSPEESGNKPLVKYAYNKNKSKKPRRNKSAFILFSIDARVKLKEDPNSVNSNEMMVKLADMWKNLDEKEKLKYTTQAKTDKVRYLKELENFWKENPSDMLQNKTKKNHVKKPCSGYALYLKEVKEEVKTKDPTLKMADVLKIVSERWKNLEEEKKQVYLSEADKAKELSRALLGESAVKNNVDKTLLLKKKKARHINEVKKQVKMDSTLDLDIGKPTPKVIPSKTPIPPPVVAEKINASFAAALPPIYNPQLLLERLMGQQPQIIKPEPIKMPSNPLLSRDHLVPQFRPYNDHQREALIQTSQLVNQNPLLIPQAISDLPLQAQKSILPISSNIFPKQQQSSKEEENHAASLLQLLDKTVKTSSELLMDLLNFDSNPGRGNSNELLHATSLRINSNPFASTVETAARSSAPKFSRAEMLNNAIASALGVDLHDDSKAEEDCTNPPGLLSLSITK